MYPIETIRKDFPILEEQVHGKSLIYLDNGATTQKPQVMIDALVQYYSSYNSNVHRGVHHLSQKATDAFEEARRTVQKFIGAEKEQEVIFTSGTTDGINIISTIFGASKVQKGDRIFVAESEHHSNIVPWQWVCEQKEAELISIPFTKEGLDIDFFEKEAKKGIKLVAIAAISNSLGVVNPIEKIIKIAKENGAYTLIDAAQSVAHQKIDVQKMDCDFMVFSGHKLYGPTGVGVLYGKFDLLNELPPYRGGGEMIAIVTMEQSTYACLPHKLEAGTPNIADVIALKTSIDYLEKIGLDTIAEYEHELVQYAYQELEKIEGIEIYGSKKNRSGAISFNHKDIHAYDIGTLLDQMGIAVRTGNHCAQPMMKCLGISGTVRATFALYNTKEEVNILVKSLKRALMMLL
ncbi:MAG: SufS family cysteine desulfurase [Flavobacteriales bacterium]|jgi:cysteine desulfurase/selenocysteine lyase|nr:SufS family cysteine desulfurase [Flavobacteriales bacterium]